MKKISIILSVMLLAAILMSITVSALENDNDENTEIPPVSDVEAPVAVKAPTVSEPEDPLYPYITNISPAENGIIISWTPFDNSYKYRLFVKNKDKIGWTKVADVLGTSYTLTGLTNNTSDTYTVRSLDTGGQYMSSYSSEGYSYHYLDAPVLTGVESVYSGVKVKWQPVDGAVNYRVYVKIGSGWKGLGNTNDTSFIYKNVTLGNNYTFTVRCYSEDSKTPTSYFVKKGVTGKYIAVPEISSFAPVSGGIRVKWSPVPGAEKYRLFIRKAGYAGWFKVADTSGTSYDHKGLTDGMVYTYTVRVLNGGNYASSYNSTGWSYTYYAPPELLNVVWDGEGHTLNWQKATGVTGCHLYRKTFDSDWKLLLHTRKRTSYYDKDIQPDTLYAYSIRYVDRGENPASMITDDITYYYNGEPANGSFEVKGGTIAFNKGKVKQGYVTISGKTYYYDSNGILTKSGIAGSAKEGYTYADQNGVCCKSEEIRLASEYMMKYCTGNTLDDKMKTGFLYMAKHFYYNRTYDHPSKGSDIPALAIDMFKNKRGNCYRYAACFACVAKIAGYRTRVVFGTTIGNPHGWVEVLVDGKWLICDPDAQIPAYGKPDYAPYMMEKHYWQITVYSRHELTINENGIAVWG